MKLHLTARGLHIICTVSVGVYLPRVKALTGMRDYRRIFTMFFSLRLPVTLLLLAVPLTRLLMIPRAVCRVRADARPVISRSLARGSRGTTSNVRANASESSCLARLSYGTSGQAGKCSESCQRTAPGCPSSCSELPRARATPRRPVLLPILRQARSVTMNRPA